MGSLDFDAGGVHGRKIPLVSGIIRLLNEENNTFCVICTLSHRHGDDWSKYEEF